MTICVFSNSWNNSENKTDTSVFVQAPYLRTNYIESNIEEYVEWKKQSRIKNLPDFISIGEAASKKYVDSKFNAPSIKKTRLMFTSMIKI